MRCGAQLQHSHLDSCERRHGWYTRGYEKLSPKLSTALLGSGPLTRCLGGSRHQIDKKASPRWRAGFYHQKNCKHTAILRNAAADFDCAPPKCAVVSLVP